MSLCVCVTLYSIASILGAHRTVCQQDAREQTGKYLTKKIRYCAYLQKVVSNVSENASCLPVCAQLLTRQENHTRIL